MHWTRSASDKVYQLFAHGRWFSPGTPASSSTKTGRYDIAEILLKVALSIKNQSNPKLRWTVNFLVCYSLIICKNLKDETDITIIS